MALKIIGSGMGRTGTHSLKEALEILGFGKCYHMVELFKNPDGLKCFTDAENGKTPDWDSLFNGYQSAIDYPVAKYYKELIKKYPDAKVIHTVRDPDSWYKSCMETIFWASKPNAGRILNMMVRMPFSSDLRKRLPVLKYNGSLIDKEFGNNLNDKARVLQSFQKRTEEVLATVPKERLLVFKVQDGWEPLCKFLNVPIPNTPFPRSNSKDEFIANVKNMSKGAKVESF
ncbi:MAG TPA: sulfotransferase [Bacteroidia bacterium]|jgi:hypothetical protein|nr:sulfotransferase [Bacteroidia bacterium]